MQIDRAEFDDSVVSSFSFSYLHSEREAEPCGDLYKAAGFLFVSRNNNFFRLTLSDFLEQKHLSFSPATNLSRSCRLILQT
jgi:hypothetical protein